MVSFWNGGRHCDRRARFDVDDFHRHQQSRQIVGWYHHAADATRGYLRSADGSFTLIDITGAERTLPIGINDRADVVGWFGAPSPRIRVQTLEKCS